MVVRCTETSCPISDTLRAGSLSLASLGMGGLYLGLDIIHLSSITGGSRCSSVSCAQGDGSPQWREPGFSFRSTLSGFLTSVRSLGSHLYSFLKSSRLPLGSLHDCHLGPCVTVVSFFLGTRNKMSLVLAYLKVSVLVCTECLFQSGTEL